MRLSPAQWRALDDFAQAGGHGYGEHAYLSRATAKALQRRGLVTLGSKTSMFRARRIAWGWATEEGKRLLRERRMTQLGF
jgi:hypothetical protein